ncbi:hypothetical protein [Chiayiivirga flava]|uniref:Uncharacterized protein n=1 Tax=Chiayiivirga flava TaxID=659595 RepID=A0A7W8FXS4_9GAMM|nr:hypothetical protein [Chiayiivirga flava]MBB5206647.1 hypothetical protein [Chiayiivirga flava]
MAHDPREPLTPDEAAVARAYTALPRPEPSPELDARVLAHARAVLASATARTRRPRPWYLLPGAGVAAAAVLAAGLAWQVGLIGDGRLHESAPATAPAVPAPDGAGRPERKDRVDVDFLEREQARAAAQAAKAEADADAGGTTPAPAAPPPPPAPRARSPEAFPAQEAAPVQDSEFAAELRAPAATAPEPAPTSAAPADVTGTLQRDGRNEQAADTSTLDRIQVTGSRIKRVDSDLPPWPEDATLAPAPWLERVRERVRAGDRDGARFSLRRYVQVHPAQPVPDDLTVLLVQ